MSAKDIITFRKANGMSELNIAVDSEPDGSDESSRHSIDKADYRINCRFCCWLSMIFFGVIALLCAVVAAIWVWNTVHVRTITLAGGQMEVAVFSFDWRPIAIMIVAVLTTLTVCFRIVCRHCQRMKKLAFDDRQQERDMRRSLVEAALKFSKPTNSADQEKSKWEISISVNKQEK